MLLDGLWKNSKNNFESILKARLLKLRDLNFIKVNSKLINKGHALKEIFWL
jgi:hypothetical protein